MGAERTNMLKEKACKKRKVLKTVVFEKRINDCVTVKEEPKKFGFLN